MKLILVNILAHQEHFSPGLGAAAVCPFSILPKQSWVLLMENSGRYQNRCCPAVPDSSEQAERLRQVNLKSSTTCLIQSAGRFQQLLCKRDSASCDHSGSRQVTKWEDTNGFSETHMALFEKMMFEGRGVTKKQKEIPAALGVRGQFLQHVCAQPSGQGSKTVIPGT